MMHYTLNLIFWAAFRAKLMINLTMSGIMCKLYAILSNDVTLSN